MRIFSAAMGIHRMIPVDLVAALLGGATFAVATYMANSTDPVAWGPTVLQTIGSLVFATAGVSFSRSDDMRRQVDAARRHLTTLANKCERLRAKLTRGAATYPELVVLAGEFGPKLKDVIADLNRMSSTPLEDEVSRIIENDRTVDSLSRELNEEAQEQVANYLPSPNETESRSSRLLEHFGDDHINVEVKVIHAAMICPVCRSRVPIAIRPELDATTNSTCPNCGAEMTVSRTEASHQKQRTKQKVPS